MEPNGFRSKVGRFFGFLGRSITNPKATFNYTTNYVSNNYLGSNLNNDEIIDLSDLNNLRITGNSKNTSSILGNDFVEINNNSFRRARDFKNTRDTLIGDNKIPLGNISTFYGIENGRFKVGPLDLFKDSTTVVANRAKNIGKIKGLIRGKDWNSYRDWKRWKKSEMRLLLSYNKKHGFKLLPGYKEEYKYDPDYILYLNTGKDYVHHRTFLNKLLPKQPSLRYDDAKYLDHRFYITENNDTINTRNYDTNSPKVVFGDEHGNSIFVGNIDKANTDTLNQYFEKNPMYPVYLDNGRFNTYLKGDTDVNEYVGNMENPKKMYIFGRKRKK